MTKQGVNEMTENPFKYISDGWTIWDNQGQSIGMMQATNLLNKLHQEKQAYLTEIRRLEEENKQLNNELNDFDFTHTKNYLEFDRDKLHFKDRHIRVDLHNRDLKIYINLPKYTELFNYTVTGKTLPQGYEELYK